MSEDQNCIKGPKVAAEPKTAGGITVFLLEELGDARLRCEQLKKYISEATELVEKSAKKDYIFEVAGQLLQGIPECLLKMEKALEAASLAASRMDYEEIKDGLKPEKVEELEKALEDVRVRKVDRKSSGGNDQGVVVRTLKNPARQSFIVTPETAGGLSRVASASEKDLPMKTPRDYIRQASVLDEAVLSRFEEGKPADPTENMSKEDAAEWKKQNVEHSDEFKAASVDKTAFGDDHEQEALHELQNYTRLLAMATKSIRQRDFKKASDNCTLCGKALLMLARELTELDEQSKTASLDKTAVDLNPNQASTILDDASDYLEHTLPISARMLSKLITMLDYPVAKRRLLTDIKELTYIAKALDVMWPEVHKTASVDKITSRYPLAATEEDAKLSRFEEGKPADPTENMDAEDAKEWKAENAKNRDNFKAASLDSAKIKRALAYVHHWEARERGGDKKGRAEAAKEAIKITGLNDAEAKILLDAIHVKPSEVGLKLASSLDPWKA